MCRSSIRASVLEWSPPSSSPCAGDMRRPSKQRRSRASNGSGFGRRATGRPGAQRSLRRRLARGESPSHPNE
jgi:hypothetical protein